MRKTILTAAALMLFSSAAMAQYRQIRKEPSHDRSCSPERQHAQRRYDPSQNKQEKDDPIRKNEEESRWDLTFGRLPIETPFWGLFERLEKGHGGGGGGGEVDKATQHAWCLSSKFR